MNTGEMDNLTRDFYFKALGMRSQLNIKIFSAKAEGVEKLLEECVKVLRHKREKVFRVPTIQIVNNRYSKFKKELSTSNRLKMSIKIPEKVTVILMCLLFWQC